MKIVTYNVNGIRAAQKLGIIDWIKTFDADIYCLQEVRANESICRQLLGNLGYEVIYNCGERAGYSGTVILTKIIPEKIEFGMGEHDTEGRMITLFYNEFIVINCYVPNGAMRLDFKLAYYNKLTTYISSLAKENNVILCSDINTAHAELDLSHPKQCSTRSGYLPIEREAITRLLSKGFIDTFRYKNPIARVYSWRSYGSRIYGGDFGWKYRFDYIIINKNFIDKIHSSTIIDLEYSDHLPVIIEFEV